MRISRPIPVVLASVLTACADAPTDVSEASRATQEPIYSPYTLPATYAVQWARAVLDGVRNERINGNRATRAFAVMGVTMYESAVGGMDQQLSVLGQLNGSAAMDHEKPVSVDTLTVLAEATHRVTTHLFADKPATSATFDTLYNNQIAARQSAISGPRLKRSIEEGTRIGDAVNAWSDADGYPVLSQAINCPWTPPPTGGEFWEPTGGAAANTRPVEPCFGSVRPSFLEHASDCLAGAPPDYSLDPSSELYQLMDEVYNFYLSRTPEQTTIALYWADLQPAAPANPTWGTPGHWMHIALQFVDTPDRTLAAAVEQLAKVGLTLGDTFIAGWYSKYQYLRLRPETYLVKRLGRTFAPLRATPQHPEHPSGHAIAAGGAAKTLTKIFGAVAFDDDSNNNFGFVSRHFADFDAAATESGDSRVYLGVHVRSASEKGVTLGHCVSDKLDSRVQFDR